MNNQTKMHIKQDEESLDRITIHLDEYITSHVIESIEDLYYEEENQMVRCIEWNHGIRNYKLVINPQGQIIWHDKGFPRNLAIDISNSVIDMLYGILEDAVRS